MLRKLLPLIALLFLVACDKADNAPKSEGCDDAIVAQLGYVPTDGDIDFNDTGCKEYLTKFRSADGKFYYTPDCTCCDLALQVINCSGEDICDEDGLCPGFADAELIGIVGIKE